MADPSIVESALRSLDSPRLAVIDAEREVPQAPGLYAVHGGPSVWQELGLGEPPDDRPLYVGKAERSLADREVRTHFSTGKTGSSTLRRSLGGLLADELRLEGQPRNLSNPEGFANFGLEDAGDARLTEWMLEHLRLAVWPSPADVVLDQFETLILTRLTPPLNLDKVVTPWPALVLSGRRRLADQARAGPRRVRLGRSWPVAKQPDADRRLQVERAALWASTQRASTGGLESFSTESASKRPDSEPFGTSSSGRSRWTQLA